MESWSPSFRRGIRDTLPLVVPIGLFAALFGALVDETFALTMNAARDPNVDIVSFKTGADLLLYTTWLSFTAVGAFLGADFDASRLGLEVFFPLVFLGLAAPFVRGRRQWVTAAASGAASLAAVLVLPREWRVTAAAILASLIGSRIK